uniref:Selenoprotein O n=1 Tax=Sphaeramia orbicularis TaxID=375764 RepID=A0A672ZCM8_9TELE
MLDFCQSSDLDCHNHDMSSDIQPSAHTYKSRWNISVTNLMKDLDHFRVSSKKLIGTMKSNISQCQIIHSCNKITGLISTETFPVDEISGNFVRTVKNCIFSKSIPTPLKGPLKLAALSKVVIEEILDLDMAVTHSSDFLQFISGGRLLPGSVPLAHRYGGHQFGFWAGQLGDGRAHSLGQYKNRKGDVWELQLKGSGKTPFSRSGDGRAVIRSSVREFLCSEAMHSLGIPTRAVVLRLAKSWFRIGSLEILAESGEIDLLRKLLDFVINEHFPSIKANDPDKYLVFYATVVNETAHLIAQWMSVGFAHGVCNTDNFSLLSITIDYGPFGFMESYNPNFVPNTSDDEGRYRIGAQANVGLFNLEKLLVSLSPVLSQKQQKEAKHILKGYVDIYQMRIHQLFKAKLGLLGEETNDGFLIAFLLQMMEDTQSDFTMTFRQLSEASADQLHIMCNICLKPFWFNSYVSKSSGLTICDALDLTLLYLFKACVKLLLGVNPRYVLRNWMAESAIQKAEMNDFSEVELLHHVLSFPFVTQETAEEAGYAARPPQWAKGLKVSCSS